MIRYGVVADTKLELENFNSALDGQFVDLSGELAIGDRTRRSYYYSVASTATPDGENIIAATGMGGVGRFIKAKSEILLTNIGSSGVATFNPVTGALNIPLLPVKRTENYLGTTNASGIYTVVYPVPFATAPAVHPDIVGGSVTNICRVTSSTATGFTVTVNNTVNALGLLPTFPALNGAVVDVLVIER